KINGVVAGDIHQGAFYRFTYDVSELLNYDGSINLLEVRVAKHSANVSVNRAERQGDFWIFGGIFRPVYLQAKPKRSIEQLAIDAKANGELTAKVFLDGSFSKATVVAQLYNSDHKPVGPEFSADLK